MYLCWQDLGTGTSGIWFAKSTDRGRSWSRERIDYRTGICVSPSGILYIVLRYWSGGSLHVWKSTDGGATWPQKVTLDAQCSYTAGYGGLNWTALTRLNDSVAGGQCKGWVTADPLGGLHIIWYHTPSWPTSASSWWSVRYQYSDDYGATIRPSIRLSDTTFRSPVSFMGEYHIILADSNVVRCVWTDGREGDLDLWFAQADLSAIGVEENPFRVYRMPEVSLSIPTVFHGTRLPVEFSLRHSADARLEILDALGRRLRSIALGPRQPGRHRVSVSGLPRSRTLFVRLVAGETVTRRCTIVR